MWTLLLLAAHLYGAATVAGCGDQRAALEIRNVHILDPETGNVTRNATIAIQNGRICRIGATSLKHNRSAHAIDGRGRYALPGFTAAAPPGSGARWIGFGITQLSQQAFLRAGDMDLELHDQLARLVSDGKTPLQALQAATLNPGTGSLTYGISSRVAVGGEANLVLLEEDPRIDIANTRSISLVVWHGQPLGLVTLARARAGRSIDLQPFSR